MLRLMRLRLTAGALAAAMLSLTAASAWAFSQQNVWSGGSGTSPPADSHYTDPDSQTSAKAFQPLGANGPTLQFGVHRGDFTPFGLSNDDNTSPPDPYYHPLFHDN